MLVYGKCECLVMQMLYVCVLCASCGNSQGCVLHDLQFVIDVSGDYMEEAYCRAGLITALYVAMIVSFCLPHPVAVSAFMICRSFCMLCVHFGTKARPRTCGCVAMGSALLCIVRSRLLVYSAGSGVNIVQVALSGFRLRLFCFVHAKTFCRYDCIYLLAALVLVCVDVMVM